jgi:hypothetical protein
MITCLPALWLFDDFHKPIEELAFVDPSLP